MAHGHTGAQSQISDHRRHQHKRVHQQERRQIPPAKHLAAQMPGLDDGPAKPAATQQAAADEQDQRNLKQRHHPVQLQNPVIVKNREGKHGEQAEKIEKKNRQKHALGNEGSNPGQHKNQQQQQGGDEGQNSIGKQIG